MSGARLRQLAAWLSAAWAGLIAALGFVAAPILFATLARADAGRAAARLFEVDAQLGVAIGAVLLVLCLQAAKAEIESAANGREASRFSAEMLLALAALFCIVAGYYGTEPLLGSARLGQGRISFAALHGIAAAFFLVKLAVVAVLAWRLGRPARTVAPTSSG